VKGCQGLNRKGLWGDLCTISVLEASVFVEHAEDFVTAQGGRVRLIRAVETAQGICWIGGASGAF